MKFNMNQYMKLDTKEITTVMILTDVIEYNWMTGVIEWKLNEVGAVKGCNWKKFQLHPFMAQTSIGT